MKGEYKGIEIAYNEHQEKFECEIDGKFIRREKLADIKKYIDNPPEKKGDKPKFERIAALDTGYGCGTKAFKKVEITSFVEGSAECWITWGKGDRSKISLSRLILDIPENREIMKSIAALEKGPGSRACDKYQPSKAGAQKFVGPLVPLECDWE